MPHRVMPANLPKKSERTPGMFPARNRRAQRQKKLRVGGYDSSLPPDMTPD